MAAVVDFDKESGQSAMDKPRPGHKRRKRRRQLALGGLAAAVVIAATVGLATLEPAAPSVSAASLWTDTVRRGEMLRQVRGPGTLVPSEIRWMAASSGGRVERVLVKPGARVEEGTVVVEMVNPEVVRQAEEARWQVDAAEADYQALRVELEDRRLSLQSTMAQVRADAESARLQAEAEKELAEANIIPAINYRRSQLNAEQLAVRLDIEEQRQAKFEESMTAQLQAQRARVEQARRTLARQEELVEGLSVRAPMAGVVQAMPVEEGQRIVLGTNVARIARPDQLIAELRIPETQAKDIQLDQPAVVDTRNGKVAGHVTRIDPAVVSGTVQVDVAFDEPLPEGARPDLSVDGVIEIERLDDVLFVGRPAYGQPGSTVSLFRVGPDGEEARRVRVELGKSSVNVIQVLSGLTEGDRVILSDTSAWDDYDRLQLD